MAEPHQKRPRDEPESTPEFTESKRQNSMQSEEQHQQLRQGEQPWSAKFQQDLSAFDFDFLPLTEVEEEEIQRGTPADAACSSSDEDEGVNSIMRHLLEASDDELGIPNCTEDTDCGEMNYAENFPFDFAGDEGPWEFEDVAAGYYIMLQSEPELFM